MVTKKIGNDGGVGKVKAGLLGALLPIALAELLVDKGVITKDELNKAIGKVVLEVYVKQKTTKSSPSRKPRVKQEVSHVRKE